MIILRKSHRWHYLTIWHDTYYHCTIAAHVTPKSNQLKQSTIHITQCCTALTPVSNVSAAAGNVPIVCIHCIRPLYPITITRDRYTVEGSVHISSCCNRDFLKTTIAETYLSSTTDTRGGYIGYIAILCCKRTISSVAEPSPASSVDTAAPDHAVNTFP